MRRVRYAVAASLDGFIAGPNGESDWIIMDPEIDFRAMFAEFDTIFVGRGTYAAMGGKGGGGMPGMKTYVFSRTLRAAGPTSVTLVGDDFADRVAAIKAEAGKDIWLFGGGGLFASLAAAGLVDTLEVMVIPVLLRGGVPLIPPGAERVNLRLLDSRTYPTGCVSLRYGVG